MSGNQFKGQEVSCCIKYFIFGFNILFWVSSSPFRLRLAQTMRREAWLESCDQGPGPGPGPGRAPVLAPLVTQISC